MELKPATLGGIQGFWDADKPQDETTRITAVESDFYIIKRECDPEEWEALHPDDLMGWHTFRGEKSGDSGEEIEGRVAVRLLELDDDPTGLGVHYRLSFESVGAMKRVKR